VGVAPSNKMREEVINGGSLGVEGRRGTGKGDEGGTV